MVHDAVPCSMCRGPIDERTFVVCSKCEVPVHADCWNAVGKCPVFACGSVQWYGAGEYLYRRRTGFDTRERTGVSRAQLEARLKDLEDRHAAARTRVWPHSVAGVLLAFSGLPMCAFGNLGPAIAVAGTVYLLAAQLILAPEAGPLEREIYATRRWIEENVARAGTARAEQKRSAVSRGSRTADPERELAERAR